MPITSIRPFWCLAFAAAGLIAAISPGSARTIRAGGIAGPNAKSDARASLDAHVMRGPLPHAIYGTIVRIAGDVILIRGRTGALWRVDTTPAVQADLVAAPLFVGKLVVAEGLIRTDGQLTAARISRLTRLDALAPDR